MNQTGFTQFLIDLASNPLVYVTVISMFIIPFLNAAVTRPTTPDWVKNLITFTLAGALAVVAWLNNLGGAGIDWHAALVVFITAAAGAGGINAALVKGAIATRLSNAVPINLGPKPLTPERARRLHSAGTPETETPPSFWGTPPTPFNG
jgi:hypothetical protein